MKVLIAEDKEVLSEIIYELLKENHIDCDIVSNGLDAIEYAKTCTYDVIILDVMMPYLNGFEALKKIREEKIPTPILILSAKTQIDDKVTGLSLGADDYLAKPFDSKELVARIKALARRSKDYVGEKVVYKDLTLDKHTYSICCNNQEIKLTNIEYKIMELLISNLNVIISKNRLIEKVWGYDSDAIYNNAEVYISFLRKKLLALNSKVIIKSTRGIGYFLYSDCDD